MIVRRYHYCIMRGLNIGPEYADGFLDMNIINYNSIGAVKAVIAAEQDPPWLPDEFVIISLTPIN